MPDGLEITVRLDAAQIEAIAVRAADLVADREASPYLDTAEAASYLRCPRSRIFDLVQLRKLTPLRDGRRLLFVRADLDAYLEAS